MGLRQRLRGWGAAWGAALVAGNPSIPPATSTPIPRDPDVVTVSGARLSDMIGQPVSRVFVYRYVPGAGFVPVPFQVDEVVDHVFNPGTPVQVTEREYDVYHEDDGFLDALDEVAVGYEDAGTAQAPPDIPWPPGTGDKRYEVQVLDPRPGAPTPQRWIYVFTGDGLPTAPGHVTWSGGETAPIATDRFTLDFSGRWLLTGFSVAAPCGSGADLIDRVKGRADLFLGNHEDEERWNDQSSYLGFRIGPVRAIRSVRGAASAVNTTLHDIVSRGMWRRTVNLRVHPLVGVSLYTDWRPGPAGTTLFTPFARAGVPVDGVPDPSIADTFVTWDVLRGDDGGAVTLYDVPASSLYTAKKYQHVDDAGFDDALPTNPLYGDEDASAYADNGLRLDGIQESNVNGLTFSLTVFPQCGGTGDADLGDAYQSFLQFPLQVTTTLQSRSPDPIRTLVVSRSGNDLVFAWQQVPGATGYRLYAAMSPSLPHASWTLVGETAGTQITDAGAALDPTVPYFSVAVVAPGGLEIW